MTLAWRGLALSVALLVGGCMPFWGFVHDEVLDGPYRMIAVDTDEQMILCVSLPNLDGCVGDSLPGPRLVGAGASTRYVVMARKPANEFGQLTEPLGRIEYYYIIRTSEEAQGRPGRLIGPLTEAQFDAAKQRLGLPEFSHVFESF